MRDFLILIGQLFLITCLQTVTEIFINTGDKPFQSSLLNIACFLGGLYLVLQYATTHLFAQIASFVRFPF